VKSPPSRGKAAKNGLGQSVEVDGPTNDIGPKQLSLTKATPADYSRCCYHYPES
jgi:hypothetical protein